MWSCPTGIVPIVRHPAGCGGCPRREAHGIAEQLLVAVPHGQAGGRYGMIAAAERADVVRLQRLQAALALWDYVLNGPIGDAVLYPAGGAADNASQRWLYEVTGGGPGWLDVRGPNPKRLGAGASRVNPAWPLADPESGGTARLVWTTATGAMVPCGAAVEFGWPSVLWGKARPVATRITPPASDDPDGVEFRLHFDDGFSAGNARVPFDAGMPPAGGRYWCAVRMEFLHPPAWKDYQAPAESAFSPRRQAIAAPGVHWLKDSDGNDCRILFPSMAPGAVRVVCNNGLPVPDIEARLFTERHGPGYRTSIDLSGLPFATADVFFLAESTAGDARRLPCQSQCSRSRLDLSGSYRHDTVQHCGKASASGFAAGLYHDRCWLPGRCDGFTLEDESEGTMGDAGHLANLWTRAGWVEEQGIPGSADPRNVVLTQHGGPSVFGFPGSYTDAVPGGYFPKRVAHFGYPLGKRVVWTGGDGHQRQRLLHGGGWLSPYDFSVDGGPSYVPDAAVRAFALGVVAELVDGWAEGKVADLRGAPWRHSAATHVYHYGADGGSLAAVNTPSASQSFLPAIDAAAVGDAAEVARLRAIYGS